MCIRDRDAGDICAISGVKNVTIGDTIAAATDPEALERISIEDPTVKMTFGVNTSPLSGRDGKYATSRVLWDRLRKELQTNVSLAVERTENANEFTVSGRGELHLSVLIEEIRREGWEFEVSKPEAITREIDGKTYEPYEKVPKRVKLDSKYLAVELPPNTSIRLNLGMRRYVNTPSYAFPWHGGKIPVPFQ